ncbi:hypothetical protein F4678DRAFT_358856 [Xylaria arbuscula]|nr:hypothetical protein F4678DRAFT_358856 [Xylaria arbuscula]
MVWKNDACVLLVGMFYYHTDFKYSSIFRTFLVFICESIATSLGFCNMGFQLFNLWQNELWSGVRTKYSRLQIYLEINTRGYSINKPGSGNITHTEQIFSDLIRTVAYRTSVNARQDDGCLLYQQYIGGTPLQCPMGLYLGISTIIPIIPSPQAVAIIWGQNQ